MGKLTNLPYYRLIGNGCYHRYDSDGRCDLVYDDDFTGAHAKRDVITVWVSVFFILALFFIISILIHF